MNHADSLQQLLRDHLDTLGVKTLTKLSAFHRYIIKLKDDIFLTQSIHHPPNTAPLALPRTIITLISRICDIPEEVVTRLWDIFREEIWQETKGFEELAMKTNIREHGLDLGFSSTRSLYPPSHICLNPECDRAKKVTKMQKAYARQGLLYTLGNGILPVYIVQLYCEVCQTSYHHVNRVHKGQRIYYDDIPDVLQVSEHRFVETKLINVWRTDMNIAWYGIFIQDV